MAMCGHYIIKPDVVLGLLGNFRGFGSFQAEKWAKNSQNQAQIYKIKHNTALLVMQLPKWL